MRQVVLDTETTGLEVSNGHRIIEIACIELNDRKHTGRILHHYVNPEREIDSEAVSIHGLDNEFLSSKPVFASIADEVLAFIENAEWVIHNAAFDIGFLEAEFERIGTEFATVKESSSIVDTLQIAQRKRPGRRNSLNALADEYGVDRSERERHSALIDAEILVKVYLALTSGQTSLELSALIDVTEHKSAPVKVRDRPVSTIVIRANEDELNLHEQFLNEIEEKSENGCIWRQIAVTQ